MSLLTISAKNHCYQQKLRLKSLNSNRTPKQPEETQRLVYCTCSQKKLTATSWAWVIFFSFYRSSVWNAWHYTKETLVHVFTAERKIQVGLIINEPVESESEHELSPFAIWWKIATFDTLCWGIFLWAQTLFTWWNEFFLFTFAEQFQKDSRINLCLTY